MAATSALAGLDEAPSSYRVNGVTYTVHPAASLFPLLKEDSQQFKDMVEDVREHGLREPIHVVGRVLVDGRNRFRAAEVAGVEIRVHELPSDTDIPAFVASVNLIRRHLSEDQLAAIGSALVKLRDAERSEAQRVGRHLRRGRAATRANGADAAGDAAPGAPATASSAGAQEPGEGASAGEAPSPDASGGDSSPVVPTSAGEEEAPPVPSRLTQGDVAGALNVSPKLLQRASSVISKVPEFEMPIRNGVLKVVDAERLARYPAPIRERTLSLLQDAGRGLSFADAFAQGRGDAPAPGAPETSKGGRKPKGPRSASGPPPAGAVDSGLPPLPGDSLPGSSPPAAPLESGTGSSPAPSPAPAPAASTRPVPVPAPSPLPTPLHFGPAHEAPTPHVESPQDVLNGVRLVMGSIALDPCSSDAAQQRVGALRWFTADQDAFAEPWKGAVYVFPPLTSDSLSRFSGRLLAELEAPRVAAAALLAPLDLRDRWCVDLLAHRTFRAVVISHGSPEFRLPDGRPWKPGYSFAVYLFGADLRVDRAVEAFSHWGEVLAVHREAL